MGRPDDDFKWFGEGFDGFPKILPEDCVEYTLHIIDSELNDFDIRENLREVQSEASKLLKKLLNHYIWQRETFALELVRDNDTPRSFLRGRTCFGDSVEDEWLIVYILRELSRSFPQLWIRIEDADGQFLLIEAADALPSWLNPQIADFRVSFVLESSGCFQTADRWQVWINNAKLMIIPTPSSVGGNHKSHPTQPPQALTLDEALDYLQSNPSKLLHLPTVEAEAFYRLQKYPKQIADSLHHGLVTIPRRLAYILHDKAAYISPGIEAFYLRDPIATRPLYASDPTKRMFPPTDLVTVSVTFTKVGYAQLKSQQFAAPPAWSDILSSNHDAISQSRAEIGMKIACGFEMLMSDPQNKDLKVVREIKLLLEDIETGEDHLPSDRDISRWKIEEDDESWLDINFEQFEKELAGSGSSKPSEIDSKGFGDKAAQENLRKMVARFESFMNDDTAGVEGAEDFDVMDEDNDNDDEFPGCDSGTDGDDEEVTFDEDKFTNMMKEMMGIPNEKTAESNPGSVSKSTGETDTRYDLDDGGEGDKICQVMHDMESELRDAGALSLDRASVTDRGVHESKAIDAGTKGFNRPGRVADEGSDAEDEDLDIDYNLAKNLLESFKSQGGVPGPSGNLMGLMGMRMPRDEEDNFTNP